MGHQMSMSLSSTTNPWLKNHHTEACASSLAGYHQNAYLKMPWKEMYPVSTFLPQCNRSAKFCVPTGWEPTTEGEVPLYDLQWPESWWSWWWVAKTSPESMSTASVSNPIELPLKPYCNAPCHESTQVGSRPKSLLTGLEDWRACLWHKWQMLKVPKCTWKS